MKKILLFACALFAGTTMYAQSVTWSCEAESADGKKIDNAILTGTVTGSETITASDITTGGGLIDPPTTCQKKFKDKEGTSFAYCENDNSLIKWAPSIESGGTKILSEGYAAGQYVIFNIEETDATKFLNPTSLTMDAVRLGTDAVRMNVKLVGNDGDYDSDWLITADNWESVSGGVGSWTNIGEGDGSDKIEGFQPAREDGAKANSSVSDGCTHVNIPIPADFPADEIYELQVQVVLYGINSNKALALHNVTLGLGNDTGISSVAVDNASEDAPAYNVAGQRVSKDAKGLVIVNGKKYLNK